MAERPRDPEAIEIGKRLTATRLALGYTTVRSLSRAADFDENLISKYEKGSAKPSRVLVRFLKERHGVTFDWLHDGDKKALPFELAMKLQDYMADDGQ